MSVVVVRRRGSEESIERCRGNSYLYKFYVWGFFIVLTKA
jgi:hypothetical protein